MHNNSFKIHNGALKIHELWGKKKKKKDNKGETRNDQVDRG